MAGMPPYEQILASAALQAGTKDFGDESLYGPALRKLLAAVDDEAAVEPVRIWRSVVQWVSLLVSRAQISALVAKHPEIREVPIQRPIFVVGLPRTGTTLLHNLLACHPDLRAPKLWEMRNPVRPENAGPTWEEVAIKETQSVLDLLYSTVPEFRAIHPMNATWPDECSWLFRHSFATMVYAYTYRIPSYAAWLCEVDMAPYYEHFRLQLQVLQWRDPSRRLVLKDPCHLWHLPALFSAFPDAEVVMLHRSLREALPSMASLCFALQRVESAHQDPVAMGAYCMDLADRGLLPAMWFQRAVDSRQITNVAYRSLVADPIGTVQQICETVGTKSGDMAAARRWLTEHRQHGPGRHKYTLEQFGMDRAMVSRRFGRYEETYLPEDLQGT
ncbi:MAG TPA: sulfotransferase [Labilithrix sp.]|jgi:hypothetical protein|nr:sulfotransferase [Labilithrix sp.]